MGSHHKKEEMSGEEIAAIRNDLIIQEDKQEQFRKVSTPVYFFGVIFILGMFFPILFLDISARIYQFVYFGIHNIPKIDRKQYVVIDREHLAKLSRIQRFSCMYCGYGNGVINWVHDLAAQTEVYSCAIKHWHPAKGQKDHQSHFFAYRTFE